MHRDRILRSGASARNTPVLIRPLVIFASLVVAMGIVACSAQEQTGGKDAKFGPIDLTADEMKAEVVAMLSIPDTLDRNRRLVQLMDSLNEDNLPGAMAAYSENLSKADPQEARLFANAWAKIDPHGAVDGILGWRYPRIQNQAVLEAVYEWVLSGGGDDARAYIDPHFQSGSIETRRSPTKFMYLAVLQGLGVAKDWDRLTQMLSDHGDDGDRQLWLTEVMVEINRANGIEAVREWVDSIPWDTPSNLKVSALSRGLHWVSGLGGDKAATWWESYEEHPRALEVLPMAVKTWGVHEPPTAVEWLLKREEGAVRSGLLREIVRGWLARSAETEAAEAWLAENLSNEEIALPAAVTYANFLVEEARYRDAADIVQKFALPQHRNRALTGALVNWAESDAEAAAAYCEEADVPEEVVEAYQRRLASKPIRVQRNQVPNAPEVKQ